MELFDDTSFIHIFNRSNSGRVRSGVSGESAPDDNLSGWRIGGPGQVATQLCKFGQVECGGSKATSSNADVLDEFIEQYDLGVREGDLR
ncbi:hypothetical protein [Bradyrhizobium canariense]|uniref:hypothetical protein n=1 Tax=Bradyrhizobium canariense TaxID=255045 RepID=UPI001177BBE0|nr:hypothetical protein [Bradyrhizobium canariense]